MDLSVAADLVALVPPQISLPPDTPLLAGAALSVVVVLVAFHHPARQLFEEVWKEGGPFALLGFFVGAIVGAALALMTPSPGNVAPGLVGVAGGVVGAVVVAKLRKRSD
jgi:hypothetical protein